LHKAGVILQDEDDAIGPGVRLRKGAAVPAPVVPAAKGKGRKGT
jgi:hypothetical protein